jgi:hypothetical protein
MVTWAEIRGYFRSNEPEGKKAQTEEEAPLRLRALNGQARQLAEDIKLRKTPNRRAYTLGTQPGDYVNNALEKQLNDLEAYLLSKGLRPPTIKINLKSINQLLGWLHRERGISLEALSLESIVPFTPLNPILDNYKYKRGKNKGVVDTRRYDAARSTLKLEAKEQAPKTVERIEEYLTWRGNHPGTDVIALIVFVNVAKFLYRNETEEKKTFDDIPVIKKLRELGSERSQLVKTTPPSVPHSEKSIPWEDALKVLRAVQKEADLRTQPSTGIPLAETTIARNIQNLLILLLFMARPPDRSRTIYELEVDRTFMFGQEVNGRFTPAARMKNPEEAVWNLHLLPADSKTGDTYGETWDGSPNTPEGFLANGKTFYYYLDLWLNQYRAVFKPTHKCLLTAPRVKKPLDDHSMRFRVRELFVKHTGVPVTPKELRKMYVTYLKDSEATAAELEGAAASMRHSLKTQSEIYDQQKRERKVAPANEFHKRSMMALFKNAKQKGA